MTRRCVREQIETAQPVEAQLAKRSIELNSRSNNLHRDQIEASLD
jgi:hypothetical protein